MKKLLLIFAFIGWCLSPIFSQLTYITVNNTEYNVNGVQTFVVETNPGYDEYDWFFGRWDETNDEWFMEVSKSEIYNKYVNNTRLTLHDDTWGYMGIKVRARSGSTWTQWYSPTYTVYHKYYPERWAELFTTSECNKVIWIAENDPAPLVTPLHEVVYLDPDEQVAEASWSCVCAVNTDEFLWEVEFNTGSGYSQIYSNIENTSISVEVEETGILRARSKVCISNIPSGDVYGTSFSNWSYIEVEQ